MTELKPKGAARYVRTVEAMWSAHARRPLVLSPREFALVADWHQRGIPLDVIRDAIAAREERPKGRSVTVRSLRQIASAVEESWSAIRDGQSAGGARGALEGDAGPFDEWQRRLAGLQAPGALGAFLLELAQRSAGGAPRETIEQELETRLPDLAPADLRERVEREIERELAPYRERMRPEQLAATRRRALGARLRSLIGLG